MFCKYSKERGVVRRLINQHKGNLIDTNISNKAKEAA